MIILKNKRGQEVGFIDDNHIYRTTRDFDKGQIFRNPKYQSGIAVDSIIIKELIVRGITKIMIEVVNFEEKPFYLETSIDNFLINSTIINFDKKIEKLGISTGYSDQRIMPMHHYTRIYFNQKSLLDFEKVKIRNEAFT